MPSRLLSYALPVLLFNLIWGAVEFFVPVRYSEGHVPVALIGFLFSLTSFISVTLDIPAGKLSDRYGRERLIAISMVIAAAALFLLYISSALWSFVLSAALVGLAYGLNWSPLLAFVSDRIKDNNGGKIFGNFFMLTALGEAIAPLAVVAIVAQGDSRLPFLLFAIIALACSGFFARLIPRRQAKRAQAQKTHRTFSYRASWKLIAADRTHNLFLIAIGFFVAFFWQSVWFTQPLIGFYEDSLLDSALIVTAFALPTLLFSNMLGRLIDRTGEKRIFIWSLILIIFSGLLFYATPLLPLKIVLIFLAATGVLGIWLVQDVIASRTHAAESRGEFFGILETVRDLSYTVTPLIIGFSFARIGLNGIFVLCSILAFLLLIFGSRLIKSKYPSPVV